jgi:hypothetical protein
VKIEVNIDDKQLEELVMERLVRSILERSQIRYDMKSSIGAAVKQHIYSNKAEIIERVVDRASREIVKKGLPKLLEKVSSDA